LGTFGDTTSDKDGPEENTSHGFLSGLRARLNTREQYNVLKTFGGKILSDLCDFGHHVDDLPSIYDLSF
jgi:hypothetical protein